MSHEEWVKQIDLELDGELSLSERAAPRGSMSETFRVGLTRDFLKPDGTLGFGDIGLELLDRAPNLEWGFLAEDTRELRPEHDGNASDEELFRFVRTLASKDKSFVFVQGMTHGGGMIGSHRQRLWHIIHAFLTCPPAPSLVPIVAVLWMLLSAVPSTLP